MRRIKLLFFTIATICFFSGFGQMYNFRNYSEDDGLPHTYVYHISQYSDGYLSLSTGEGYTMFDGNKFTTFTSKEIADNFVTTHFIDSRKIVWLGFAQNGVQYLKNEKFNKLKSNELNSYKTTQISEDHKNKVWIANSGGLFTIDTLFNLKAVVEKDRFSVNSFVFNSRQQVLAATTEGLKIINGDGKIKSITFLEGKNIKQIASAVNSDDTFWLIAEGEGVYGIRFNGTEYVPIAHILTELKSQTNQVNAIYCDHIGNLWISVFGEGLRKISFSNLYKEVVTISIINKENGLKNEYIQSIFQDYEGNMWFGTFGEGLIEKPIEKFSYYNDIDGLKNINVKKIVVDRYGKIWVGSNNGLGYFIPATQSYSFFDGHNGFVNDEVNTLMLDRNGVIWIGTNTNGIFTYNTSTHQFENFSKKHGLSQVSINCIIENKLGDIFIGTNEGLCMFDTHADSVTIMTTMNGLLHNNVLSLFMDSKRRLWISSHGASPYFFKDSKFTTFNKIEDLKTFNINSICEDKAGNIWIATEGDGVFKYSGHSFVNYKMTSGLLSNYCYGITVDNYSSVWVTHKIGLSEKKAALKEFHSMSSREGLLFVENNLNAFYKDSIGNIWFGTTKGLVHYNSEIRKENNEEPKLAINKIVLDGITYRQVSRIEKKYGFYSLHIDFLAISLTNPEKIKYKYRLLGIDSVWKMTNMSFVDYPNLSDGDYTFQVMACNNEGLWTSNPVEVVINIKEPLWKKIWFYPVLIILIILATYLVVHWRTRNLQKGQVLLQEKVDEKTFLLQKEKEQVELVKVELEQRNKDMMDSINYARRIQDSLLPGEDTLNKLFKNKFFIFYKPKDIVSGDFYWSAGSFNRKNEESLSLACIADCTGHGVPGAFLSIMASDILKQSLTETTINNPAETLDFLNKHVTSSLNSSSNNLNRLNDGMDIAFIGIDYKKGRLHYSGANNSIYIFRKTTEEYEMYELKSTKKAIGSGIDDGVKYELQSFDLCEGDTIYLFSDGYADQFGGDRDKKLNYKRFKQILLEAFELPLSLQKMYIEQKFEEWKGNTEQTDDVCVMGIKF
ncbi:MAG: two-component regulator propeller domain-containing protein [Bacteroidota bacterium]